MKRFSRLILVSIGTFFVILGVIGIFVPLIPTTSPLLAAAWCYARSSPRFYHWLLHNRWFGSFITNYREGRGMPMRSKVTTLLTLWLTIGATAIIAQPRWWVTAILLAVALGVTAHIVTLKTLRAPAGDAQSRQERPDGTASGQGL